MDHSTKIGTTTNEASPFHLGERAVQKRAGSPAAIHKWASRFLHVEIPEEHQLFYSQLPFVILAGADRRTRPWATMLTGEPGFASALDAQHLRIWGGPLEDDALSGALREGDDVGLLGIELHTRRRNRLNGWLAKSEREGLIVRSRQSYGNCPQHITPRAWRPQVREASSFLPHRGERWSVAVRQMIQEADTFFIATGYAGGEDETSTGFDASHRGGPPGFVRVKDERTLVFPDYRGNNLFNTLGNLHEDPRAGLLFVDFATGSLLQMTGSIEVDWQPDEEAEARGAQRLLHFTLEEFVLRSEVLPLVFAHLPAP